MIKLIMLRHYEFQESPFSTVRAAALAALDGLGEDATFPVRIEKDGVDIWKQSESFHVYKELKKLAGNID